MYSSYQKEPDFPAALGLFSHLNAEELKELLNNDSKFDEMMKDVKQIKDIEAEKEMIMASNKSLAEFNLSREPQLIVGKQRLQELSEEGASLCHSIENKVSKLKENSGDISLETSLALLQTAAAESEEESDAIAEKFLEGEMDLENFLDQFAARRKLMHLRRVKADKMAEILTRQPNMIQQNSAATPVHSYTSHATYSNSPMPPITGPVPYPVGNIPMPMPGAYPNMY